MRALPTLLVVAALAGAARAGTFRPSATATANTVPGGMNYQGRLEQNGFPMTGNQTMTFTVFDSLTAGKQLWTSNALTVLVTEGIFSVVLNIPAATLYCYKTPSTSCQNYLELTVNGVTLAPRDPINSVPYAKVAESVEGTIDVSTSGLTFTTPVGNTLSVSSSAGNVGIGTNTPQWRLTVSSGAGESGPIVVVSTGGSNLVVIDGNGIVTANGFVGDGTNLGNVVRKFGDGMTGPLTLDGSSLTVTGTAMSVGGSLLAVAGGNVGVGTGAPLAGLTAANDTSLIGPATVGSTLTVQGNAFSVNATKLVVSGGNVGVGTAAPLANLSVAADSSLIGPATVGSTLTVKGTAFSVGATALDVTGGQVGIGMVPGATLDVFGTANFGSVARSSFGTTGALTMAPNAGVTLSGSGGIGLGATGNITLGGGKVTGLPLPAGGTDAANKTYVDGRLTSGGGPWSDFAGTVQLSTPNETVAIQTTGTSFSVNSTDLDVTGGQVGIGAAPAAKLDVRGSAAFGNTGTQSSFGTSGALSMANSTNITLSGTGIVTGLAAPSAGSDATNKTYVDGKAVTAGNTSLTASGNLGTVNTLVLNVGNANSWSAAQTFTANSNFPGSGIWNTSGNLGVGTASPLNKLDVAGTGSVTGSATFGSSVTAQGTIQGNSGLDITAGAVALPATSVANAALQNSGVLTVTGVSGLSGGGAVALGGSTSLSLNLGNANSWTVTQTMSNAALNLTGVNGNVVGASSITTTGEFFGNGFGLMNLNGANVTGSIPGNSANVNGVVAVGNGGTGTSSTLNGVVLGGSPMTALAAGAGLQVLRRNSGNTAFEFFAPTPGGDPVGTSRSISNDATLTGGGNLTADRTLGINLSNANTWAALQTFSAGATLSSGGHLATTGTAPTISACGTGAAVAVGSTDNAGVITIGATPPVASCAISFNAVFASAPTCVISISNGRVYTSVAAAVGTLTVASTTLATGDAINYICLGH